MSTDSGIADNTLYTSDTDAATTASSNNVSPISNQSAAKSYNKSEITVKQYTQSLIEKDNRIRILENENKRLQSSLTATISNYESRMEGMLKELDRLAKLSQDVQHCTCQKKKKPQTIPKKKPKETPITDQSLGAIFSGLYDNPDMPLSIPSSSEEICAALSSFVEKNKHNTIDEEAIAALLNVPNSGEILECISRLCTGTGSINDATLLTNADQNNSDFSDMAQLYADVPEWKPEKKSSKKSKAQQPQPLPEDIDVNAAELLNLILNNGGADIDNGMGDLKADPNWDLDKTASGGGGGSSTKPLTEEEQRIVTALHERIAINVARLGNHALNTVEIAKECKRIMIAYNIGQRLFARFVMNQVVKSQGSLSELLSKPRPWHRLTDKGREAFKRIFGWLCDDQAIELVHSLSPRRTSLKFEKVEHPKPETMIESFDGSPVKLPEIQTPEEINSIKEAIQSAKTVAQTSKVAAPTSTPTSPGHQRSGSRWRHDDISKEKILDIFETEKAKSTELETKVKTTPPVKKSPVKIETIPLVEAEAPRTSSEPISLTQQDFEKFPNLNTDEIVQEVKEYLSNNSISQRQFGEKILGLSQGSVSDLLAKPKWWDFLTQKGREPFIRMRIFLDEAYKFAKNEETPYGELLEDLQNTAGISVDNLNDVSAAKSLASTVDLDDSSADGLFIDELNSVDICTRVKDCLSKEGISNSVFIKNFIPDQTFEVEEFMKKPEKYVNIELLRKLNEFLADKNALEALRDAQSKVRKSHAPRSTSPGLPFVTLNNATKRKAPEEVRTGSPAHKTPRFTRTVITDRQKEALLYVYQQNQRPNAAIIGGLHKILGLSTRTITNWFHNYRTRQKAREAKQSDVGSSILKGNCSDHELVSICSEIDDLINKANSDENTGGRASTTEPTSNGSPSAPIDEEDELSGGGSKTAGVLDKAIARIHQLAAARGSTQLCV